jgi:hypothetical protein
MRLRAPGIVALSALFLSGCVPALREPPALEELAGPASAEAGEDPVRLTALADERFHQRRPDAVREAAELYGRVAAQVPDRIEPLVGAIRARIWLADHGADPAERKEDATVAVQLAQWCGRRAPEEPACDYWLGAALGVQARERRGTALDALPRIVELFTAAAQRDPTIDRAGPDRALALLFVRAPGWPRGPGDPDLGLEHARRAVDRNPDHPPNRLALAEALRETGDRAGSRRELESALESARELDPVEAPDAPEWIGKAEDALQELEKGR